MSDHAEPKPAGARSAGAASVKKPPLAAQAPPRPVPTKESDADKPSYDKFLRVIRR